MASRGKPALGSGQIAAPNRPNAAVFYFTFMRRLFPPLLPSFPKRTRRLLLAGIVLSFLAGPAAVQILILILTGLT
ncbi:hypothetical protein [Roseovarius sp. D22-M7]|uniref:hypothetical protein n=1 Tax=Roseovarius sp. D22-M7 TaxID=3127116 RepID=UPI0030100589